MKTLYLQCSMGAAGDMLTAALADLLTSPEAFAARFNALGIPKVEMRLEKKSTCGIEGLHSHIFVDGVEEDEHLHDHSHANHSHEEHAHDHDHDHDHHEHDHHHDHDHDHHDHEHHHHSHTSLKDIEAIVSGLSLSEKVKTDILAVYRLIAEAESHAHGKPVEEIHFHEVGTLDAVADVTAVCMLMEELSPKQVLASPVYVGSGTVRCAHGILPVPAPATAYILRGVPIYGGKVEGELCTPTGAALLKYFVSDFGEMPVMKTEAVGYGLGKKDFAQANCVRAFVGDTPVSTEKENAEELTEEILELSCNLDDMTGEEIGFACERLFEAGALDVWTVPIGMKKDRPGVLLGVLCRKEDKSRLVRTLFLHTSSIGIRETPVRRYLLDRRVEEVSTSLGKLRVKYTEGYGVKKEKPEFDDMARIAQEKGISLREVRKAL